jgi:hypothetical protein
MRAAALLLGLALAVAGCGGGRVPFEATPPVPTRQVTAAELVKGQWTEAPTVFRIRQSALFEFRGAKVPMAGFLILDLQRREVRLVGLNDLGVKLFDLGVTSEGFQEHFLMPELSNIPGLTGAVAESVRRIFLAPQPGAADALRIGGELYHLTRMEDGRQLQFTFGGPGALLLEKTAIGGGEDWCARYYKYRPVEDTLFPGGIVLQDRRAGYRLTLWMEEVNRSHE